MSDPALNPYEPSNSGDRSRRSRHVWWFAILVGLLVLPILVPIALISFQAAREHQARERARRNLMQIKAALDAYQQRVAVPTDSRSADEE